MMENYDQQNNQRDALPVFENPAQPTHQQPVYEQGNYQQPAYQQPIYQQPMYQQPVYQPAAPQQTEIPRLKELASSAFTNGLVSLILAEIPIGSIIAISMGAKAQGMAAEAESMAAHYGVSAGGKCKAGKIMGLVGKILGIVYTVGWSFYLLYLIFVVAMVAGGF